MTKTQTKTQRRLRRKKARLNTQRRDEIYEELGSPPFTRYRLKKDVFEVLVCQHCHRDPDGEEYAIKQEACGHSCDSYCCGEDYDGCQCPHHHHRVWVNILVADDALASLEGDLFNARQNRSLHHK